MTPSNADAPPERGTGLYTNVPHDRWDSVAAQCLSEGAFNLMLWAHRLTEAEAYRRKTKCPTIRLTWGEYQRPIGRDTFTKYRAELLSHGFLKVASVAKAEYRPTEQWRKYQPTEAERGRRGSLESVPERCVSNGARGNARGECPSSRMCASAGPSDTNCAILKKSSNKIESTWHDRGI